ncbi:MAG: hypothetical protein JXA10_00100 [Anaerolineae bacterium]|nr:hypothetical protein [Anaerolineae bacterium]
MPKMNSETKVITVTLNPLLDFTLVTNFVALGYHNQTTESTRLDPAGRGISIARALHSLGVPVHAIVLVGHDTVGRTYQTLLAEEEFPISLIRRAGCTSSRVIVKDTGHKNETLISEASDGVTHENIQSVVKMLQELVGPDDTVVFAGSLPGNLPTDTYAWLVDIAQSAGAKVAINAGGGDPLLQSLKAEPDFVYLTQNQAEGLFNRPIRVYEDIVGVAQKLREQGAKTVMIATDQIPSAVLVAEKNVWVAKWKEEAEGTQSGRAEALIAGYLAGRLDHFSRDEALELGVAAATYTVSQLGHEFGTLKDLQERTEEVDVSSIDSGGETV